MPLPLRYLGSGWNRGVEVPTSSTVTYSEDSAGQDDRSTLLYWGEEEGGKLRNVSAGPQDNSGHHILDDLRDPMLCLL